MSGDFTIEHPNRAKAASKATKAVIIKTTSFPIDDEELLLTDVTLRSVSDGGPSSR